MSAVYVAHVKEAQPLGCLGYPFQEQLSGGQTIKIRLY